MWKRIFYREKGGYDMQRVVLLVWKSLSFCLLITLLFILAGPAGAKAAGECITASNLDHIDQDRAYRCGFFYWRACAVGSRDNLGWATNFYSQTSTLQETGGNYWEEVASCPDEPDPEPDPDPGGGEIVNGQTISDLSDAQSEWLYYYVNIPEDASDLTVQISGGNGDADLYTRFGAEPTRWSYDCRPYLAGNNETCTHEAPEAGVWHIGLHAYRAYSGASLSVEFDESSPAPDPDPGDLTYTVTAVDDNLDNTDMYDMVDELEALGYSENIIDTNVTTSELSNYLQQATTTLYHTGHGDEGYVATAYSGGLDTQDMIPNKIKVQNTIFATCLTVKDRSWRYAFGASAKTLAGYTKVSYDITDEAVVKDFGDYLADGRSYQMAWYLANNNQSNLADRWLIFVREGSAIVEYSASSGNTPNSISKVLTTVDQAGKVEVAEHLLYNHRDYRHAFGRLRLLPAAKTSSVKSMVFQKLVLTEMSRNDAIEKCRDHLRTVGELADNLHLNRSYSIRSRKHDNASWDNVGWATRYTMTAKDGLQIRGNGCEPNKSLIVTGTGAVVAMSKYWPQIVVEQATVTHLGLLTPSQALDRAKEEISRRVKKGSLAIIDVEPVYGVGKPGDEEQLLIPSYGFSTTDNFIIVVNAMTGKLLP
jgi:hypothetical protein